MLILQNVPLAVIIAIAISAAMIATSIFIVFYHNTKHEELESWVEFSFSGDGFRQVFGYYRFMAVSMLIFYVLFTCSCLFLQSSGYMIFSDGKHPVIGGPIATAMFGLDLVLRGGFFDVMEHFDLRITTLYINKGSWGFWFYSFIFRMFYGVTLIKIIISFAWIYGKIRIAHQNARRSSVEFRRFD